MALSVKLEKTDGMFQHTDVLINEWLEDSIIISQVCSALNPASG